VCAASLLACKPPPAPAEDNQDGDQPAEQTTPEAPAATGPVARVNGKEVPRADFQRQMDRTRARFERAGREIAPQLEARLKENLIRKLVDDELIRQKAAAESVSVDAATLDAKFAEHKQRFGSDEAFKSFLERTSQTEEDVKSDLERNLLRDALFSKLMTGQEPTEEDAKKYYEENKAKYKQREQVRASHILLKVARTDAADVKEAQRKKAEDLLKQAKKPGADFAALARESSQGPTAPKGGDLGAFSRGRMVKEFEDAAFKAKVGQVIGPVETKFGFHIIKVFEKTPERQRTYDEVKDSILTSLKARAKSRATREILRTMKTEAKIEILEPGVQLDRRARPPMPMRAGGQPPVVPKGGAMGGKPHGGRPMPIGNPAAAAKAKAAMEAAKQAAQKAEGAQQ
jgi:peptidyl-prolyl cis-trans isomerase C